MTLTRRSVLLLFALAASAASGVPAAHAQSAGGALGEAIRRLRPDGGREGWRLGPRGEIDALWRMYDGPGAAPLWSGDGRPTPRALVAIALLEGAETHGLDPAEYSAATLRRDAAALERAASSDSVAAARFDVLLSRSVVRLLSHLHEGRVDPRAAGADLPRSGAPADFAAGALELWRAPDLAAALSAWEPPYAAYHALLNALARYRELAADTSLRAPRTGGPRALRPGDPYADAPDLRRLLVALGDLEAANAVTAGDSVAVYDAALADAVALFQQRHGLEPDGVLGPATMAQLRAPLSKRVRQIELTLERWRWLPHRPAQRFLVVNVPEFRLDAFDGPPGGASQLAMRVIVGQATGRHGTPYFAGTMREVVFRPYWDVPLRIARNELLPIIRRRPGYMDAEGFEIVRGGEADAVAYPPTRANLARVAAGTLRLRQRPGPKNALGAVKFVFPNPYSVYLHGTPALRLFEHARRDFSHGCIRTEDPTALAAFALRGEAGWDRAEIERAMRAEKTLHVPLQQPIAVYVTYATAVARGDVVSFFPDLYGRDATLARELMRRAPALERGSVSDRP
jgi:murein L,D-transpeptidase YcbB/YkuD